MRPSAIVRPKPVFAMAFIREWSWRLAILALPWQTRWFAEGPTLSLYCQGLNQSSSGSDKNSSLINLHLATGQIGKPGAGPFSLTGQPNAMGGREAGLLSHQLPGYRTVENAEHRREVESYWGCRPGAISPKVGLTAVEMFRALEKGQLKAIWIAGTNPAVSLPDLHHIRRALQRAQLVVVQDAYHPTETSRFADVVLPAAQWGEKEWTSTNSERTIGYSPRLFAPPGAALPDWQILCLIGERLEAKLQPDATPPTSWSFPSTAAILAEMARVTPIYGGIRHERLLVTATGLNTLLWRVLAMEPGGASYVEGFWSPFDRGRVIRFDRFASDRALFDQLRGNWGLERMAWFSHGFFKVERRGAAATIRTGLSPTMTGFSRMTIGSSQRM